MWEIHQRSVHLHSNTYVRIHRWFECNKKEGLINPSEVGAADRAKSGFHGRLKRYNN